MKANLKRYTKQNKNNKKIYTPHNSQYMEATQVAFHHQRNGRRRCSIYRLEDYLAIKNETLPFAAALADVENIVLSEMSDRNISYITTISFICGI